MIHKFGCQILLLIAFNVSFISPHMLAHVGAQEVRSELVFSVFNEDGTSDLYSIHADATGQIKLTNASIPGFIYDLAVSPDGTQIAFLLHLSRTARSRSVYRFDMDSAQVQPVLEDSNRVVYTSVMWSPDGSSLLLQDESSALRRQSLINLDGSDLHVVQELVRGNRVIAADWVEDGRLFASDQTGTLFWLNPDGSDRVRIADVGLSYHYVYAVPSPDLSTFAFVNFDNSPNTIDIMDMEGTVVQRISEPAWEGGRIGSTKLLWSPDGGQIAYIAGREIGQFSLMIIGAHGTNRQQLSANSLQVFAFDWLPQLANLTPAKRSLPVSRSLLHL